MKIKKEPLLWNSDGFPTQSVYQQTQYGDKVRTNVMKRWWFSNPSSESTQTKWRSSKNHCDETLLWWFSNPIGVSTWQNVDQVRTTVMKLWWFSNTIRVSTRQYIDQVHVRTTVMKQWWFSNSISILTQTICRSSKNDCYEILMVLQLSQCFNTDSM